MARDQAGPSRLRATGTLFAVGALTTPLVVASPAAATERPVGGPETAASTTPPTVSLPVQTVDTRDRATGRSIRALQPQPRPNGVAQPLRGGGAPAHACGDAEASRCRTGIQAPGTDVPAVGGWIRAAVPLLRGSPRRLLTIPSRSNEGSRRHPRNARSPGHVPWAPALVAGAGFEPATSGL